MLYMITLAFANLVRTTVTIGELLVWTFFAVFSAVAVYMVFGDSSATELIRLKIYCFTISNFVVWFLFLVVVGGIGTPNDIKGNKDEQHN